MTVRPLIAISLLSTHAGVPHRDASSGARSKPNRRYALFRTEVKEMLVILARRTAKRSPGYWVFEESNESNPDRIYLGKSFYAKTGSRRIERGLWVWVGFVLDRSFRRAVFSVHVGFYPQRLEERAKKSGRPFDSFRSRLTKLGWSRVSKDGELPLGKDMPPEIFGRESLRAIPQLERFVAERMEEIEVAGAFNLNRLCLARPSD